MSWTEGVWRFCSVREKFLLTQANGPQNHDVEVCVE